MEKKMETAKENCGYLGDNGKENGNYYIIIGFRHKSEVLKQPGGFETSSPKTPQP